MIIKSIVVIDGKEVEVKELEDKEAFAESVNQRVLFDRNYIIELIPIERRNFPEEDHKQEKIQHKRKERDSAARGLIAVTVASMMLNAVMAMIIYILQAGPI